MFLDEHTSKQLLAEGGVSVPRGTLLSPNDVGSFRNNYGYPCVVKAQVLSGGRGKAGGVVLARDEDEFRVACSKVFSLDINGHKVRLVRVEPAAEFEQEFYLSFAVSRARERLMLTVGRAGGVDVESGGSGSLLSQPISPCDGLQPHEMRAAFFHLYPDGDPETKALWPGFQSLLKALFRTVNEYGLLLAEINPLVVDGQGQWVALDGKVEIDDTVVDLRPELNRFHRPAHFGPEENQAREAGLSFHALDGWVGLLVNGAGLAMATMDVLNFSSIPAANFMDLGGAADAERMKTALSILFRHERVRAVFLNLFGGIVSCESVARALAETLDGAAPKKPLVLRLDGNGAAEGRALLESLHQEDIHLAADMTEALAILSEMASKDEKSSSTPSPTVPEPRPSAFNNPRTTSPDAVPLGLDKDSRVLVQGITGRAARNHVRLMLDYGTNIVAGVTPFKGGLEVEGVPVFDSVRRALEDQERIEASIIFVPGAFAADAILEAFEASIPNIVCITEGIPQQDMLRVRERMAGSPCRLIGPNTPGVIVPGQCKIGIMPAQVFTPGPVAVFSRSGTLTYEASARLSEAGIGQSLCVGIGGDPFIGTRFTDLLDEVAADANTRAVLVLGEIGGRAEEDLAAHVRKRKLDLPVVGFVAGRTAPPGKRLGHAGAVLDEKSGSIGEKLGIMAEAGFHLCPDLRSLPSILKGVLEQDGE